MNKPKLPRWFLGTTPSGETTKGDIGGESKGPAKRPVASTMVGFCTADKRFLACEDSWIPWKWRGKPCVNPSERNITVEWLYLEKRYKSLLNFTGVGRWGFGSWGFGIGSRSCWLLWLGTKSTNTHSMGTHTLGAGMLKGTSSTLSPLVKFKAITFRDNAGLRKAWPKGVPRKRAFLTNGLLWSHPQFPMDDSPRKSWWLILP